MSAINSARDSGHTKVVRLLLEHEAGVQGKDTSTQHPPCAAYPLSDATVFPHPLTRSFNTHTMAEILYGEDRTPNGVNRAKKIPRKDTRFRKSSGNIAAIDFGTKNCSLAYITKRDSLELIGGGLPKLPLNGTHLQVPAAILLNADDKVEAFGYDARTMYRNMEDEEKCAATFFEGIKTNLQRDQVRMLVWIPL